jgi:hypothetical protein
VPHPSAWADSLGRVITLRGVARDAKLGALLDLGGGETIWIDGLESWPDELHRRHVEVSGELVERDDLPVFEQPPGEPLRAGIAVQPGDDLELARRRYLLARTTWRLLT